MHNESRLLLRSRFFYNEIRKEREEGDKMKAQGVLAIAVCLLLCLTGCAGREQIETTSSGESPSAGNAGLLDRADSQQEPDSFAPADQMAEPYMSGSTLGDLQLTWYNNIDPAKTVEIVNYLKEHAEAGDTVFYDIYTEEEKATDPEKEDTGLFFFKGEPGEKFAVCNAGGGFAYVGAMQDTDMDSGLFVDIGGASTELVEFEHGQVNQASSYPIGSLKLYRDCVKQILPGKGSYHRMEKALQRELGHLPSSNLPCGQIAAVGGSARAALKLARTVFQLPQTCRTVTAVQLDEVFALLRSDQRTAADLILKAAPERLHTLIPGLMILRHVVRTFEANEVIVSRYGVREGYLCQKVQSKL